MGHCTVFRPMPIIYRLLLEYGSAQGSINENVGNVGK
jgi:hypothetical protein